MDENLQTLETKEQAEVKVTLEQALEVYEKLLKDIALKSIIVARVIDAIM